MIAAFCFEIFMKSYKWEEIAGGGDVHTCLCLGEELKLGPPEWYLNVLTTTPLYQSINFYMLLQQAACITKNGNSTPYPTPRVFVSLILPSHKCRSFLDRCVMLLKFFFQIKQLSKLSQARTRRQQTYYISKSHVTFGYFDDVDLVAFFLAVEILPFQCMLQTGTGFVCG